MEEFEHLPAVTDPLLSCCLCGRLLQDAVQLTCLHNCCRRCFRAKLSTGSNEAVACGVCDASTHANEVQPNRLIDCQAQRYISAAESKMCGPCKENGERDKPAQVWCSACRHSLCGECMVAHKQLKKQHITQSFDELKTLEDLWSQPSVLPCAIHEKPVDVACVDCEQAKCVVCCAECMEKKHEVRVVGTASFDRYAKELIDTILSMENDLTRKSPILQKPNGVLQERESIRDRHLQDISMRKRRIVEAVEMAYRVIECLTKNAYDDLEVDDRGAAADADRIAALLSDCQSYVRRLLESNDKCQIINQQKAVRQRLRALSSAVDALSDKLTAAASKAIKMDWQQQPDDLESMVQLWIGKPVLQQLVPLSPAAAAAPVLQQQQQQQQSSPSVATSAAQQQQLPSATGTSL